MVSSWGECRSVPAVPPERKLHSEKCWKHRLTRGIEELVTMDTLPMPSLRVAGWTRTGMAMVMRAGTRSTADQ